MAKRICSIPACGKPMNAKGYCHKHYDRWRKWGDPNYTPVIYGDDEARFWSKVNKTSTCWLWTGPFTKKHETYGQFHVSGVKWQAHRWAYTQAFGPVPPGLQIRHRCDTPACVNPDHLELGTTRDNMDDRIKRKTGARAMKHGNAKLTSQQVADIRQRYAAGGISQTTLAAEYRTSQTHVSRIVLGLTRNDG